ncbi:MAG: glycosyltransferase [Bacteroidetes bacterium]|nr:glycosyltransferase [Bacteroidota bacterium]
MKILVTGSDKIYAIENYYAKYFRAFGHEVIHFPAQRLFLDEYTSSFYKKLRFKLYNNSIYSKINTDLIKSLKEQSSLPDVAIVFKGMEIFPDTLKIIKDQGIKLVNYNPDNPFLFSGKGSGNANITKSISLYDFHFTYNLSVKKRLEEEYRAKTAWLPFGFDLTDEQFSECVKEEEIVKVCFVGNPDKERAAFINALAEMKVQIVVYGHHWKKFIDHPGVEIQDAVYAGEQWKTLRRYRVQLNLMRPHNPDSHNMRTFEVPGVGGIMLAPDTLEHRTFFEEGKEVFLFNDVNECVDKINSLLRLTVSQANEIRKNARARSIASGYTYRDRSLHVANVLRSL